MAKGIKRGLAISGGGSWGAYGAGVLAALNNDYDDITAISTGALMSPLVAIKKHDVLKEAYTSVTDSDIMDRKWYEPKPVTKNGEPNILALLYAIIRGRTSFTTTKNSLRKLIDKFLLEEYYKEVVDKNKNVFVGAQNLREKPSKLHYFNVQDCEYEDFKDWMWASACAPFYFDLVEKEWTADDGNTYIGQWTDGGVSELVAVEHLIDSMKKYKGYKKEIDIVIHRPEPVVNYQVSEIKNIVIKGRKVLNAMRYDIEFEDILKLSNECAKKNNMTVNVYYLPRVLSSNSLVFNKELMNQWWEEGFNSVVNDNPMKKSFTPKS